jgi:hypothetical protein
MTLKTLKDFPIMGESVGYGKVSWDRNLIEVADLRKEAINWIKEINTVKYPCKIEIINWIKEFFNIQESDLK